VGLPFYGGGHEAKGCGDLAYSHVAGEKLFGFLVFKWGIGWGGGRKGQDEEERCLIVSFKESKDSNVFGNEDLGLIEVQGLKGQTRGTWHFGGL